MSLRDESNIVDIIAGAQRDLEELKQKQYIGYDVLKVHEWNGTVTSAGIGNTHKVRITLTPKNSVGCLPVGIHLKFTPKPNDEGGLMPPYNFEPQYTGNNSYAWNITYEDYIGYGTTSVLLQYIGEATVTMVDR